HLARAPGEAQPPTVDELVADPGRLVVLRVDQRDVGHVDGRFLFDYAALLLGALAHMALDDVHPLDDDAVLLGHNAQNRAALALVAAGDHDDVVALAHFQAAALGGLGLVVGHHSTSGARLMIFR